MLNFFLPILACVADELIGSIRLLRCEVRIACLWLTHRESTLFKNFVHSDVADVMPADSFIWKFVWIFVFVLKGNRKFIRPHRQTTKYTSCIWMKSSSFPFNITGFYCTFKIKCCIRKRCIDELNLHKLLITQNYVNSSHLSHNIPGFNITYFWDHFVSLIQIYLISIYSSLIFFLQIYFAGSSISQPAHMGLWTTVTLNFFVIKRVIL